MDRTACRLHNYAVVPEMCMKTRPSRSALAMLILTTGLALCDGACASIKRSSSRASQSIGLAASQRRNPPNVSTPKPRDTPAGAGIAASERVETPDRLTTEVTPSKPTAGDSSTAAWSTTSSESPSTVVTSTTTYPRLGTEVEHTSRGLWPFLIGVAIAVGVGLILFFRPSVLKAR